MSVQQFLDGEIAAAQKKIDRFIELLREDPAKAFEWSADEAMKAAACIRVYTGLKAWSPRQKLNELRNMARDEGCRKARFPHRSTNQCANLMHQEEAAAFCGFADNLRFQGITERGEDGDWTEGQRPG